MVDFELVDVAILIKSKIGNLYVYLHSEYKFLLISNLFSFYNYTN